jgi:hypothetical protein
MKLKAKIEINGKEIDMNIEVSEEELAKLQKEKKRDVGYGYGHLNDLYYVVLGDDYVSLVNNSDFTQKMQAYDKACNLYHDKTLAENNARADKLMRQLRRFAAEHSYNNLSPNNKYEIYYDKFSEKQISVAPICNKKYFGAIQFDSLETAQLALDKFHDELVWYFQEYLRK